MRNLLCYPLCDTIPSEQRSILELEFRGWSMFQHFSDYSGYKDSTTHKLISDQDTTHVGSNETIIECSGDRQHAIKKIFKRPQWLWCFFVSQVRIRPRQSVTLLLNKDGIKVESVTDVIGLKYQTHQGQPFLSWHLFLCPIELCLTRSCLLLKIQAKGTSLQIMYSLVEATPSMEPTPTP